MDEANRKSERRGGKFSPVRRNCSLDIPENHSASRYRSIGTVHGWSLLSPNFDWRGSPRIGQKTEAIFPQRIPKRNPRLKIGKPSSSDARHVPEPLSLWRKFRRPAPGGGRGGAPGEDGLRGEELRVESRGKKCRVDDEGSGPVGDIQKPPRPPLLFLPGPGQSRRCGT